MVLLADTMSSLRSCDRLLWSPGVDVVAALALGPLPILGSHLDVFNSSQ